MTNSIVIGDSNQVYFNDIDSSLVMKYKWHIHSGSYVATKISWQLVLMHRLILSAQNGEIVDHIDGNGLNNTRSNLRICTHAENMRNRKKHKNNNSGFKGVYKSGDRYRAQIRFNGNKINLGRFDTPEDAHNAYILSSNELHGRFARSA